MVKIEISTVHIFPRVNAGSSQQFVKINKTKQNKLEFILLLIKNEDSVKH